MSGFHYLIDYQCPQCGAPAVLAETSRLFSCEFCRVRSYLITKVLFRYMLPHSAPENRDILYIPYWRFKGTLFSFARGTVNRRFMDISHQAVSSPVVPLSLGLRSQALKLRFVTPETPGHFLRPSHSIKTVMRLFADRFTANLSAPPLHKVFLGENLSLIYAPFYEDSGRLMDAVLNEPVGKDASETEKIGSAPGGRPRWRLGFVPTLCPSCGWDMSGEPDTLYLTCENCSSVWHPASDGLKRFVFGRLPGDGNTSAWFPFWRIKADISDVDLKSYADLIRIANLIKVPLPGDDERRFYFWIPAFKVQPRFFIQFARHMTLAQPTDEIEKELPSGQSIPVNFPVTEAAESLKIVLSSFMKPQKALEAVLADMHITPRKYLLAYVPFEEDPHDYVQKKFQIAVNKNMLKLSGNL